jgi:hypothetical protein
MLMNTNTQAHLVKKNQLGAQFILSIFINLYMFPVTMGPSSGETTVFMRHLVLVILCGCTVHTRQSSTQNNKYQVSHKQVVFARNM